jgi:O-antigen ligase
MLAVTHSAFPHSSGAARGANPSIMRWSLGLALVAAGLSRFERVTGLLLAVAVALAVVSWANTKFRTTAVTAPLLVFTAMYVGSGYVLGGYPNPISDPNEALQSIATEGRWIAGVLIAAAAGAARRDAAQELVASTLRVGAWLAATTLVTASFFPGTIRQGHLHGLTSSHHVPGMLFGSLLVTSAVVDRGWVRTRRVLLFGAPVALSDSRTALLALAVVLAAVALHEMLSSGRFRMVIGLVLIVGLALIASERSRATLLFLTEPQASEALVGSFTAETRQQAIAEAETAAVANMLVRVRLYGTGLRHGSEAWLFGVGPGHYRDVLSGVEMVESRWGLPPRFLDDGRATSEVTAHNAYVHAFVESGIVGLILLLRFARRLLARVPLDIHAARTLAPGLFALALGLTSGGLFTLAASIPAIPLSLLVRSSAGPRP